MSLAAVFGAAILLTTGVSLERPTPPRRNVQRRLAGEGGSDDGDMVKLINQCNPANGYLDACGHSGRGGYGVETSRKPNRDGGSGTWQIVLST